MAIDVMTSAGGSVAVIGNSYLRIPFAVENGKHSRINACYIKLSCIAELRADCDHTREAPAGQSAKARHLTLMVEPADLAAAQEFYRDQGVQALHRYCDMFWNLNSVLIRDSIKQRL